MLVSVLFGVICFLLLLYWLTRDPYSHIPGPSLWDIFWNNRIDHTKTHLLLSALKAKHGPVFKLPQFGKPVLILSDYESIHQASVSNGKALGGRPSFFRLDTLMKRTGIIFRYNPDDAWKSLRKTAQRHLRQFGDGLSRLEAITFDVAEDMFTEFGSQSGKPYDPKRIIFDTALNTIAFLIIGKRVETGDPIVEQMRQFETNLTKALAVKTSFGVKIFDIFPWVRHLGIGSWSLFTHLLDLESKIWSGAEKYSDENPEADSIYKVFKEQLEADDTNLSKIDVIKSTLNLLAAGVATTSNSFYALINILAHHKDVQDRINDEIEKIQEETGRHPALSDKPNMHYTRAVLLELSRYLSIAPAGVPHRNITETHIKGLKIPADTQIMLNQWDLHHDEQFWNKPYTFDPERFLDDAGQVVPADHPNREHLMPFGAGVRVCLGQSLAQTRLFIWLKTAIQRFTIEPAPGNDIQSTDPRNFSFEAILRPLHYEVVLKKKE